ATVRMSPFPQPVDVASARMPAVDFVLNGTPVATVPLHVTTDRVGAYEIVLPRAAVRRGENEILMRVAHAQSGAQGEMPVRPGLSDSDAAALWYVRVHPPTRAAQ